MKKFDNLSDEQPIPIIRWNTIPFVQLVIPLILGIYTTTFFPPTVNCYNASFFIIPCLALLLAILNLQSLQKFTETKLLFFGTFNFLTWASIGYLITTLNTQTFDNQYYTHFLPTATDAIVQINEPLQPKTQSYKTTAKIIATIDSTGQITATKGKALIYFDKKDTLYKWQYGDILQVKAKIFTPVATPKNPNQFNYKQYLAHQNIFTQAYINAAANPTFLGINQANFFWEKIYFLRTYFLNAINQYVSNPNSQAVASAILLGYTAYLDTETLDTYSHTGAMHILSVSGMHVGIFYAVLSFFLSLFIKKNPSKKALWLKFTLVLVGVWLYTLLTGIPPSAFRAALMFSLMELARCLNRSKNAINLIAASAFFILLYNPFNIFHLGFQLSYAAVVGLVLWQQPISHIFTPKNWLAKHFWEVIAMSLAAQAATLPLLLYYFGQFPIYFLVTNVILVDLAGFILIIGLIFLFFSFITPLALYLGKIVNASIYLMNYVLQKIDDLPFSVINYLKINILQCFLLCFILALASIYFKTNKKPQVLKIALIAYIIFLFAYIFNTIQSLQNPKIHIYSIKKGSAIEAIQGKNSILFADTTALEGYRFNIKPFHQQNNVFENNPIDFQQINNKIFEYNQQKIGILSNTFSSADSLQWNAQNTPISYLLLTHNTHANIEYWLQKTNCNKVIFDGTNTYKQIKKWEKILQKHPTISTHNIIENGALIIQ